MRHALIAIFLLCSAVFSARGAGEGLLPEHVLVLYNASSAYSHSCAREYARLRGVPDQNLVPLPCASDREEITWEEYQTTIERPLLAEVSRRQWKLPTLVGGLRPVYALLLMPEMPLKIKDRPHEGGWRRTMAASVDSELSCLGRGAGGGGAVPNPYYGKEETIVHSGLEVNLTCRIGAASREAVGRMIFDPVTVEADGGLWGRLVVDEGGPYKEGDAWLKEAARLGWQAGFPVLHDVQRRSLAPSYPLGRDVALYFGWYERHANGPFGKEGKFRFGKGAIAVHMHSFSCVSLADPARYWCAPLLERGAAVTFGNVYEPYLGLLTRPEVFLDRLLKGYSVAEAAWMATPALSWQNVVLGDPLYRPFAMRGSGKVPITGQNRFFQTWKALLDSCQGNEGRIRQKVDYAANVSGSSLFHEWDFCRAMERKNWELADARLRLAAARAADDETRTRLGLLRADMLWRQNRKKEGEELMKEMVQTHMYSPYKAAVEDWCRRFAPAAPRKEEPSKTSPQKK